MEKIFVGCVLPMLLFGFTLIMVKLRQLSFVVGLIFIFAAIAIFIWNYFPVEVYLSSITGTEVEAWSLKAILVTIRGYIRPTYVMHIGFVLIVSVLGIWFGVFLNKRTNKKAEQDLSKTQKDNIESERELLPRKPHECDISNKYIFDDYVGWSINPITDEIVCSVCLKDKDNKSEEHLKKDWSKWTRWVCPKCNKPYDSPVRALKKLFFKQSRASVIGPQSEKKF